RAPAREKRQPTWLSILAADQCEKVDARRRGFCTLAVALSVDARSYGREHSLFDGVTVPLALPKRVADRIQARFSLVAPEDVGNAPSARRDLPRRPRHRRFAQIERSAIAADAAAQHDQSGFGRPQLHVIDGIYDRPEWLFDFLGVRLRQNR